MFMKKCILIVILVFVCVSSAQGVVMDDVMEAFVKNGLRQAGKNSDEVADILRKTGGTFSNILQSDSDYLRRANQILDNDTLGLGKKLTQLDNTIDLTKAGRHADDVADLMKTGRHTDDIADIIKGGRHTDDFGDMTKGLRYGDDILELSSAQLDVLKNFTKGQKAMAISIQNTITHIAKLPDGTEIITKLGKKGLVFGAAYGDEALISAYNLNKSGALSLVNETKHVSDGDLFKLIKESNVGIPLADVSTMRRISNMDAVDAMKGVAKRYGPVGAKNVSNLCADIAKRAMNFVYNNPKKH